jgi:hypothetical protein
MRVRSFLVTALLVMSSSAADVARGAYPLVPGTGREITAVGDDFEDESWEYVPNWPKSSNNIDKRTRNPGGYSTNGRWFEAALRGQPDYVARVDTPPNGLPGSRGALMLRTLQSGIPGQPSGQDQQDDFIANLRSRIGAYIPISYEPSVVTRIYMPPVEQWENRNGSQFAFRAGVRGGDENEEYWPGIFIQAASRGRGVESAYLVIRADGRGRDIRSIAIEQTGWWTLGMSFTADGRVHYFAKPGVQNLTKDDYLTSYVPYNMPVRKFETFFFDCFNKDDGRSWSTPFVIDDTSLYVVRGGEQLEAVAARTLQPKRTAAPAAPAATQEPQQRTTTQNRTAVGQRSTRQN